MICAGRVAVRHARLMSGRLCDIVVQNGDVVQISAPHSTGGDLVVDAGGGALLPGLHDHHVHVAAAAAELVSIACGPPAVHDASDLIRTLRSASTALPAGAWLRGVGYHESVAGEIDARWLDAVVADRPIRIQHRSGASWVLNGVATTHLRLDELHESGIERDAAGRLTGRLRRADHLLRRQPVDDEIRSGIVAFAGRARGLGLTGVTDATPELDSTGVTLLATATERLRVVALGLRNTESSSGVEPGPWKIIIDDEALPGIVELVERICYQHDRRRAVAVHCTSRPALLLTLSAFEDAGAFAGDRIEHAAVVGVDDVVRMRALGLRVVTQPAFIAARGDSYEGVTRPDETLYPYQSLLAAGVDVVASSDAPYGWPDPWRTMAAARDRISPSRATLGDGERVDVRTALAGYLSDPHDPGGRPRTIKVGERADFCLLDGPLERVLRDVSKQHVRLTMLGADLEYPDVAVGHGIRPEPMP